MLDHGQLTPGQRAVWKLALDTREHLFITGHAGTGKSALLERVIYDLKSRGRGVRVCAFTGLAAQRLGGTTISRLLGLGLAKGVHDADKRRLARARRSLEGATDIVLDEVSQVSGDFLHLMDLTMQEATGEQEPFGGIRMIFSGDFLQLPSVHNERDPDVRWKWAFQNPVFALTTKVALTESMRQVGEQDIRILADLRRGEITPLARNFLDSCVGRELQSPTELYPINRLVHQVNAKRLEEIDSPAWNYPTYFEPEHLANEFLGQVPVGASVDLKHGCPVIILENDPRGRYVNGSQGTVVDMDWRDVSVRLHTGDVVVIERKTWRIKDGAGKTFGYVEGLPLHLGWAATIHRAQGMTLDNVKTDVSRCWEPGQAYVALTRTRRLQDISLLKRVSHLKVDPEALAFTLNVPGATDGPDRENLQDCDQLPAVRSRRNGGALRGLWRAFARLLGA